MILRNTLKAMRAAKIKYIYVGNIAYKVINGFTERINYDTK